MYLILPLAKSESALAAIVSGKCNENRDEFSCKVT